MNEKKDVAKTEGHAVEQSSQLPTMTPVVDIYENENEILLFADMPGVTKENIRVNIDNGKLSVSGVRKLDTVGTADWEEFGDVEYLRNFSVPQSIDVAKVNAELKDGVLKLHLPKSEAAKPRQIEIKAE